MWLPLAGGFVGGLLVGWLLTGRKGHLVPRGSIQTLIATEADRQGLPRSWALAFADLESQFNPEAIGDRDWPSRPCRAGRGCYEEDVLGNPVYEDNPNRERRAAWVSYGLFQLLSPFALERAIRQQLVSPDAPPEALLDVDINVQLGVASIKNLFEATGGDFVEARFRAAGCADRQCDRAEVIASRAAGAMDDWGIEALG